MLASRIYCAALIGLAASSVLRAQDTTATCACRPVQEHTPSEFQRRSAGSIAFVQGRPQGELADNIHFGYGVDGTYVLRLDTRGILGLRADGGILGYGDESKHVPLSETVGGRIQVKVTTTNYVVPLSIGPQLMWPTGAFRPYVNAGVGAQLFYTQSGVEGDDNVSYDFASTTNQSDWTSTWVVGGGAYMELYRDRTTVVSFDIGAHYIAGGRAQYLRPGSIQDLPNAQIAITPLESSTHLMLVRLGLRISGL